MKHYVNCRFCSSIGSENICSSCSLKDEHLSLPELYSAPKQKKQPTEKQLFIHECVERVKRLSNEESY